MDELTQLRDLIFTAEKKQLQRLETHVTDPEQRSKDMAEILPAALLRVREHEKLVKALQQPVERCFKNAIQQDPKPFAKAIMPVIGPVLKKTIAEALRAIREFLHDQQSHLDNIETRINKIEQGQITDLLNRLAYIEQTVAYLNELEQQVNHLERSKISQLYTQYDEITQQFKATSQNLQQRIDLLETNAVKQLNKRITLLEKGLARIQDLETFLNDAEKRIKEMATYLPRAIREATEAKKVDQDAQTPQSEQQIELIDSLLSPVEECLRRSVNQDAHNIANALFPVMGPAIRRSINETFKSIVQAVNTSVEHSLSPQGLAWRLESMRSGKSFADIVLKNTLAYRVEQVFLIHRESGLLIQHLTQDASEMGDSDAISAMLTAIQDFIRDSFSKQKNEELDTVEIGDYNVWLERGPLAILACVIRGVTPNEELRIEMRNLLEKLHIRYAQPLAQFSGDGSTFDTSRISLHSLLKSEEKESITAKKGKLSKPFFILLGVLFLFSCVGGYFYLSHQYLLDRYINALENTPGIVLFSVKTGWSQIDLRGLRDPIAQDPIEIAQTIGLDEKYIKAQWTAYQDLNPLFVEQRIRKWLKPPDTVQIVMQQGTLYVKGYADSEWIKKLNDNLIMISGMSSINLSELVDENAFLSQTEEIFNHYIKALKNTPGIVIISTGIEDKKRFINGLRDPLAESLKTIAQREKLPDTVFNNIAMHWNQYQDLTTAFIEKRAKYQLNPPQTVKLSVIENTLYFDGYAPQAWIDDITKNATTVAGVYQIDRSKLITTDEFLLSLAQQKLTPTATVQLSVKNGVLSIVGHLSHAEIIVLNEKLTHLQDFAGIDKQQLIDREQLVQLIENTTIFFKEEADLINESQLMPLINQLKQLTTIYTQVKIQIIGDTDGLGTQLYNEQLSQQRAQIVYNWLISKGVDKKYLTITLPKLIKFGENTPDLLQRRVNFKIILDNRLTTDIVQ